MAEISSKTSKKVLAGATATAAKPAAKKPAAAKASSVQKPAVKPVAKKSVDKAPVKAGAVKTVAAKRANQSAGKAMTVSAEQRYRMVAEAAYYRAETNHFKSDPLRDWIEAESDITTLLSGVK